MLSSFKNNVGIKICDIAFWYDNKFLSDLTFDEKSWSNLQLLNWKIFNYLYRVGCYLQRD